MSDTLVAVALTAVTWAPPGVDAAAWRGALAEDLVDVVHTLDGVDTAVAASPADAALAEAVRWPTTRRYHLDDRAGHGVEAAATQVLASAAADGYRRAAVLCADAPDLPAMLIGKLLRPLTTRQVSLAPAVGGGLLGVAARLPAPEWLGGVLVTGAAGAPGGVATAQAWHRLRGVADLDRLDPRLEGWDATRALLGR